MDSAERSDEMAGRTKALIVVAVTTAGVLTGTATSPLSSAEAVSSVAPSAAQAASVLEFGIPVWSPLRVPARVNCVRTNCPGPFHDYWAIDFISSLREPAGVQPYDPLYAVAPGIFHIGGLDSRCTTAVNGGNWVWIDHGGGRRTRYHHLETVTAKEGQRVTPRTKIGTVGHSGFVCTNANYLHMEFRVNNVRVAPPSMFACVGTRRVTLPQWLGYPTWNQVPTNQNPKTGLKPNVYTPRSTNACMP
jgi:hypothetical protein